MLEGGGAKPLWAAATEVVALQPPAGRCSGPYDPLDSPWSATS